MSNVRHPVVLYRLEESDPGYDKGARFRIDDIVGDGSTLHAKGIPGVLVLHGQFHFFTEAAAQEFMAAHGMRQIRESEMRDLRKAIADNAP